MPSMRKPLHDSSDRTVHGVPLANVAQYRDAVVTFTQALAPWTHFCTLTLEEQISDRYAELLLRLWARTAANLARAHLPIAWAIGPQADGRPHFHVLLCLPAEVRGPRITCKTLKQIWEWRAKAGVADIRRYKAGGGAARYMADHEDMSWAIVCSWGSRCRRRGRGCQVTSFPF